MSKHEATILGEAVLNAGAKLGLSSEEVGRAIGRNRTTIARSGVDPSTPSGQLAMMLVRIYRGLYVLVGGSEVDISHWMHTKIRTLQAVPADMIFDVAGMVRVVEYVDAMRGNSSIFLVRFQLALCGLPLCPGRNE